MTAELTPSGKKAIDDVMRRMAEAHYAGDILSIAVIMIDKDGSPNLEMGIGGTNLCYHVIAGCEILKNQLIEMILDKAGGPAKFREGDGV